MEVSVYLIHFDQPLAHAQHYVGSAEDVKARVREHRAGRGARLLQVIQDLGIGWRVVRVWPCAGRAHEKRIKAAGHSPRLCPVCNPKTCYCHQV